VLFVAGVSLKSFHDSEHLVDNFDLVATGRDRQGREYVTIVEGKRVRVRLGPRPGHICHDSLLAMALVVLGDNLIQGLDRKT
jgi:hypothetical protein